LCSAARCHNHQVNPPLRPVEATNIYHEYLWQPIPFSIDWIIDPEQVVKGMPEFVDKILYRIAVIAALPRLVLSAAEG